MNNHCNTFMLNMLYFIYRFILYILFKKKKKPLLYYALISYRINIIIN